MVWSVRGWMFLLISWADECIDGWMVEWIGCERCTVRCDVGGGYNVTDSKKRFPGCSWRDHISAFCKAICYTAALMLTSVQLALTLCGWNHFWWKSLTGETLRSTHAPAVPVYTQKTSLVHNKSSRVALESLCTQTPEIKCFTVYFRFMSKIRYVANITERVSHFVLQCKSYKFIQQTCILNSVFKCGVQTEELVIFTPNVTLSSNLTIQVVLSGFNSI